MEQGIIRGVKSTGGPSHITSYHDAMNVYFKSAPAMARTVADNPTILRRKVRTTPTTSSLAFLSMTQMLCTMFYHIASFSKIRGC